MRYQKGKRFQYNNSGYMMLDPEGKYFAYLQGFDPGVSFIAEYNPNNVRISVAAGNCCDNAWKTMRNIRKEYY